MYADEYEDEHHDDYLDQYEDDEPVESRHGTFVCDHDEGVKCPGACAQGYYISGYDCSWHGRPPWQIGGDVIDILCESCNEGFVAPFSPRRLVVSERPRKVLKAWDKELQRVL